MERNMFGRYANDLARLGASGRGAPEFSLGREGKYELQYIPFEHVNANARLVIVGITPGPTQLDLAYSTAQRLIRADLPESEVLFEIKKAVAFGGAAMKPNLLRLLRHFRFEQLLSIDDVASLWDVNAELLHSTSTVPHAAFKSGGMFAGTFDEVMASPLLKPCFMDCFVPSAMEMNKDAVFVGLGQCPQTALEWCVNEGVLARRQVLGSFCHPSTSGGSTVKFYLRETSVADLKPADPVLHRADWLDQAYEQMRAATTERIGGAFQRLIPVKVLLDLAAKKPVAASTVSKGKRMKSTNQTIATTSDATAAILSEVERAGYKSTNTTSKLSEFQLPGGQTVYVVKTTSKLNNINVMVHPGNKLETLRAIAGVDSVSDEHRFHSNMTKFPKRFNRGETQTAFGWQVTITTLTGLQRFLSSFKAVRCA